MDTLFPGEPTENFRPERTSARRSGSLAVRHRPRRFGDVVGQRHVTVPLRRALAAGSLPQQLLFSGGSGLGKTTIARIVAAAMLCEQPVVGADGLDACGSCASCRDIADGRHVDVVELDAASHGGVDRIRDLAAKASLVPMRAERKVYIVDEVHGLTAVGGQAFLKLLEEPPPHVTFLLATTDPERMLVTNRSRCAEFELLSPPTAAVVQHLITVAEREGVPLDPAVAEALAASVPKDLGVRGALVALDKLLPVLDDGRIEPDRLADVLGEPPWSGIDRIADAIVRCDPGEAISSLLELRNRFPVTRIAERLAERLNRDLVAVCTQRPIDGPAFDLAVRRCGVVARALGAPEVVVFAAVAELSAPVSTTADSLPGESPADSTEPVADAQLRAFLDALTSRSRLAAAVLRSGRPRIDGTVLSVALSAPARLRLGEFESALEEAAQSTGIGVVLTETDG